MMIRDWRHFSSQRKVSNAGLFLYKKSLYSIEHIALLSNFWNINTAKKGKMVSN